MELNEGPVSHLSKQSYDGTDYWLQMEDTVTLHLVLSVPPEKTV